MALLGLGFVFWLTDVLGRRAWAWPFKVMGMNAIAAFTASTLVVRIGRLVLVHDTPVYHNGIMQPAGPEPVGIQSVAQHHVSNAVHHASDWFASLSPHMPTIATAQNLSLAWALCFVCIIFLITLVLYGCRIFVKV